MAAIPTNSRSSCLRILARPSKTDRDPEQKLAFGFVLDYDCRLRWAKYFLDEYQKDRPSKLTPEQFEERREGYMTAVNTTLPDYVYAAHPDFPRLRRRLLPIEDGELDYDRWVFALRDNTTTRNLSFPLSQEHIEAIRKELGLADDQQPQWVPLGIF